MSLQFHRAVDDMEIWSASSDGFSFVISFENPTGSGFHGRVGYVASWRPVYQNRGAIKITGSPFKAFAEAEAACNAMLDHLTSENWHAASEKFAVVTTSERIRPLPRQPADVRIAKFLAASYASAAASSIQAARKCGVLNRGNSDAGGIVFWYARKYRRR